MSAVNLEQLDEAISKCKIQPQEVVDTNDGIENLQEQDILEAFEHLHRCLKLLNYLSDPVLCKTISNRERTTINRVSDGITGYLDEVEENYE